MYMRQKWRTSPTASLELRVCNGSTILLRHVFQSSPHASRPLGAPIDMQPRNADRFTSAIAIGRQSGRSARLEGRRTVREAHIEEARRFAGFAALAGILILLPLLPASAAEANGAGDTALVAAPPSLTAS
jgi:hypothetical protein